MRILIVNPPHPAIGSRIPREQLPPLGLLSIGGPLLDAGHDVTLLDAEFGPLSHNEIVENVVAHRPQILLIGHSGSTSAHPIVVDLTRRCRQRLPRLTIIYGGVFPTYHFRDILHQEPQIDVIVRGEGEATMTQLISALEQRDDLANVDLKKIRKGSATNTDRDAIKLLRQHGILSLATWVTDFEEVTDRDFIRSLRQLLWYDPDQLMSLYVTPHRWTGYYRLASERRVIQLDQRKWDYKHQVLETVQMKPWRIFLWVKLIELILQARPKALWRSFLQSDRASRHGMNWFTRMGRRVLMHEIWTFIWGDRRVKNGPTLEQFWGAPQDHQDIPLRMRPSQEAPSPLESSEPLLS